MRSVLVGVLAALSVLACGCEDTPPAAPRSHLGLEAGDQRLLVHRGQTTSSARYRAVVPRGTRKLLLRADCSGAEQGARLTVAVSTFASGGFGCDLASGAGGLVLLGATHGELAGGGTRTVTVTAPRGATWSVAVDSE